MNRPGPSEAGPWRLCVAPMMERTDRHFRFLLRLICRHARLYTEMLPAAALLHGDARRLLRFHPVEHPVALQLGGAEPHMLARCASLAEAWGFDEINLNVGCPSDRVQAGRFGACLMAEPERVAECISAMSERVLVPVTVKTRLGIDQCDSYDFLQRFVSIVARAGCGTFIVHARKAWLKGLSPKQNRQIPPLCYAPVQRLKHDFPQLTIVINGGFRDHGQIQAQLQHVDGVMVGREAYDNPFLFADSDARFYGRRCTGLSREQVAIAYADYVAAELERGAPLSALLRHIMGLYRGQPGARAWRRMLSTPGEAAGAARLHKALAACRGARHRVA